MEKKRKGDLAELAVAARLMKEGWNVLFPFGDRLRYDLVAERDGMFLRVQVKYVTPRRGALIINCFSSNNWSVRSYKKDEIDILAAFDSVSEKIYFLPFATLNGTCLTLRLEKTKNNQVAGIHPIEFYERLPEIMQEAKKTLSPA